MTRRVIKFHEQATLEQLALAYYRVLKASRELEDEEPPKVDLPSWKQDVAPELVRDAEAGLKAKGVDGQRFLDAWNRRNLYD